MATLNINGQRVTVDDSFLKLPHDQQQATVDEIAKTLNTAPAEPPDKYQQAATEDRANLLENGVNPDAGLARLAVQGATFNTADELLAAARTPFEMVKRGTFNPAEGYRYAKAQEDLALEQGRKNEGLLGTAADIGGGILTGSGLARAGLTAGRLLAPNAGLAARSLASAADAAGMGTVAGAAEGNTAAERIKNALIGGAAGAAVGGVAPGALKVAGAMASPVTSNIRARVDPAGYARSQIARALMESSQSPQNIADAVTQAAREGQGVFTVADAMGNPGQRMLSTVTRAPGPGRTAAVEFLDSRQAGQGRRIANALTEGFDSPQTAAQTEAALTQARNAAADAEYGAVRNDANPVDLGATIRRIDETLSPGVNQVANPQSNIANDSVESALQGVRSRLTDGRSVLTDFTAVQRVRGELSDAIEAARRQGAGNKARLLGGVLRELDTAMEAASAGHRAANANFANASRTIDTVQTGRDASMRGRVEDTVPAFRAMPAAQQDAFRSGYVDPLVAQTQGAALGANKARPLTNDAFRTETATMAPMRTQAQMQRRIGRENTMFETRAQATGGSKTADNLADEAAMGVDPTLIGHALTGNISGVVRTGLAAGHRALTGNTPAVREQIARMLLMRGGNVTSQQMQDILEQAIKRVRATQLIASHLGRGASAALAVAPATQR